jgi:uncharacterized protein
MHYLLFYQASPSYLDRRPQFRDAHLEAAWASHDRGQLLLGGALLDPTDLAVLLFKADSPAVVEEFARKDPYVTNGLVSRWWIRPWMTVAGATAADPMPPATARAPTSAP